MDVGRRAALRLSIALPTLVLGAATLRAQGISGAEQRMRDRGILLPPFTPVPGINNVPFVRTGNLVFLSGVGPRGPDGRLLTGRVGADISVDVAYQHARSAGITQLSILRAAVGSLDSVVRVVKVFGMVQATPEFRDHPRVINGCSDLYVEVFGEERGRHARTAVGMASLPFGISVEVESIFEVT